MNIADSTIKQAVDSNYLHMNDLQPSNNYMPMGVHIRQRWLNRRSTLKENCPDEIPSVCGKQTGQEAMKKKKKTKRKNKAVKFQPGCQVIPLQQALANQESKRIHIVMPKVMYEARCDVKGIVRLDQPVFPSEFTHKKTGMISGVVYAKSQPSDAQKSSTPSIVRGEKSFKGGKGNKRVGFTRRSPPSSSRKPTKSNSYVAGSKKIAKFMTKLKPRRKFDQNHVGLDECEHGSPSVGLSDQPKRRVHNIKILKRVRGKKVNYAEKDLNLKPKQNFKTKSRVGSRDDLKSLKATDNVVTGKSTKQSELSAKNGSVPKRITFAKNKNPELGVCDTSKLGPSSSAATNPKKSAFQPQPLRIKSHRQERLFTAKVSYSAPKKKARVKPNLATRPSNVDKTVQTTFTDQPNVMYRPDDMRTFMEVSRIRECVVENRKHLRRALSSPGQSTYHHSSASVVPASRDWPGNMSDRPMDVLPPIDNQYGQVERTDVCLTSVLLKELQQKLSSVKTKGHITSSEVGFKNHQLHPANCVFLGNTLPRTRQELGVTFIKKPLYHRYICERLGLIRWGQPEKKPKGKKRKKRKRIRNREEQK